MILYYLLLACNLMSAFASRCFGGKSIPKILGAHFTHCHASASWQCLGSTANNYNPPLPTAAPHIFLHICTTMIIILAILAAIRASPLGPPSPLVLRDQLQPPPCSDPHGCRSLWDIIRSCGFTIFLCTWAAVHPNIPSPDERWPKIAVRRVGLMFAALVVPEAIVGWALRQRLAAIKLAEEHKDKGWTITHGFFAIMGGFMEYEGNQPIRVLLPAQLQSYSLTGNGDFPKISKAEIEDKSKGDAISKVVVILQTSWFVTQCIARVVQRLPITELELVTIAFATLNVVIYFMWWHKPLNVQRGARVYKQRITGQPIDDGDVETSVGFWDALRDTLSKFPAAIADGPLVHELSQVSWTFRVILWPFIKPLQILDISPVHRYKDLKRVTTFYPDDWDGSSRNILFVLIPVTAIASVFGGIHCIGWRFTFPSSLEQTLWRLASVSITVVPIMIASFGIYISWTQQESFENTWVLLIAIYTSGRLVLLVLPFLCLRSLSPAAYHVVHWTSFIPHV